MKKLILSIAVSCILMSVQAQKLQNFQDSLSYAYGIILAQETQNQMVEGINPKFVKAGMEDYLKGQVDDKALKNAQLMKFKAIDDAKKLASEKSKEAGMAFLEKISKEKGVKEGEGYYYKILQKGKGESPAPGSVVTIHYEGTTINGEVFDSSYERGQTATFDLDRLIKGWQIAVPEMKIGEKRRLYLPYNLAYGERGAGDKILPYATLIFDIELIDFQK